MAWATLLIIRLNYRSRGGDNRKPPQMENRLQSGVEILEGICIVLCKT